ncbi:uncharacterized protein G2W53_020224 [Senna tora]|uniref:Uncharacterized protein n=1 Tax=Senna tora TaxID=362788 RepID=A0A834U003_9FABA|nr:uncharacterized protein G2W53_020224 [Senna tora]
MGEEVAGSAGTWKWDSISFVFPNEIQQSMNEIQIGTCVGFGNCICRAMAKRAILTQSSLLYFDYVPWFISSHFMADLVGTQFNLPYFPTLLSPLVEHTSWIEPSEWESLLPETACPLFKDKQSCPNAILTSQPSFISKLEELLGFLYRLPFEFLSLQTASSLNDATKSKALLAAATAFAALEALSSAAALAASAALVAAIAAVFEASTISSEEEGEAASEAVTQEAASGDGEDAAVSPSELCFFSPARRRFRGGKRTSASK